MIEYRVFISFTVVILRKSRRDILFNGQDFGISQRSELFVASAKREFHAVLSDEHNEVAYLVSGHVDVLTD